MGSVNTINTSVDPTVRKFDQFGPRAIVLVAILHEKVRNVDGLPARERMAIGYGDGFARPLHYVVIAIAESHERMLPARSIAGWTITGVFCWIGQAVDALGEAAHGMTLRAAQKLGVAAPVMPKSVVGLRKPLR